MAISLPLACGDDAEGGDGKGGSSGSAGQGGKGGTSGTSGSGGNSGTSGTAGKGGSAGKGGTSGASGTSGTGGAAGAAGGMGGTDDGGMGGEGGGGTMPTQCEAICAKSPHCTDHSTCEADLCTSYLACAEPFGQALTDCLENETTSANYYCFDDKPIYNYDAGGPCDDELDAWIAQGC